MNPIERCMMLTDDLLNNTGSRLAFFKGDHEPDVLVLGEAPGPQENKAGIPFVGDCGDELNRLLAQSGLSKVKLCYLNAVFRMPVGDNGGFRTPTAEEIAVYRPMVREVIDFLAPKFILACGNVACYSLLNCQGIMGIRGQWHAGNVMPTFHPGYTLRNKQARLLVIQDMRNVVERFNQSRTGRRF